MILERYAGKSIEWASRQGRQFETAKTEAALFKGRRGHKNISNDPSFRPKHPGVPDGSDGSDRTSYPLTEN